LMAVFDTNGLLDLTVDGRNAGDIDGHEFSAIVADHVRGRLPAEHPCYFVACGQFEVSRV